MPSQHNRGRRLHDRFLIDLSDRSTAYSFVAANNEKLPITLTEISNDSVTCFVSSNLSIPLGTPISLVIKDKKNFAGKISSLIQKNGKTRLGISFSEKNLLSFFTPKEITSDQRNKNRRDKNDKKAGQRVFERRGFWPGLSSKRFFSQHAWELENQGFYFFMKPLQSGTGAHVIVDGKEMIMMSSNNYLGLSIHPKVKEASIKAIEKYGSAPSASSLLGGTLDIHVELEEKLAKFKHAEAACVFSSGYVTNLSTLTTILGKDDVVLNDDKNHASLLDGSRLSGAKFRAYRHKNMADLNQKLEKYKGLNKLVTTDSVFSMDGDIAPLDEIYRLCKKHSAALMVDEAHATGVYGENGRGLLEHFGLEGKPEITMGTLSKSLSGIGGFICGSKELVRILKNTARGFVFSAYIPPSICAAVITCLEIIKDEPERRKQLWRNTEQMRSGLIAMGFNVGESQSPIIPVIFPTEDETNKMTRGLRKEGIYVSPAIYPAVKKNATRVRATIMATHTEQDIENALAAFKKVRDSILTNA